MERHVATTTRSPIAWLDRRLGEHRNRRLLVGVAALLACLGAAATLGRLAEGGHGLTILKVELAADGQDVWDGSSFGRALLWDIPFIAAYVLCGVVAARALMPFYRVRLLRTKGPTLVMILALAAGGLDLVEDLFLAMGAAGDSRTGPDGFFLVAAVFAISKFVVLAAVVAVLLTALVAGIFVRGWLFSAMYAEGEGKKDDNLASVKEMEASQRFGPKVGICLSGGGVRAASLTLGCLQELERATPETPDGTLGWSKDQDKRVTAVSGGAYMAGAWQLGRAYDPDAWRAGEDGTASPEEKHLLSNLGYLASTWSRGHRGELGAPTPEGEDKEVVDRLRSGASVWATVFVGFMANLLVIVSALCLLVVTATVVLDALVELTDDCNLKREVGVPRSCVVGEPRFWLPPVFWVALGATSAALWVLVSKVKWLRRRVGVLKAFRGATRGTLALGLSLAVLLVGFPYLIQIVYRWDWQSALGMVGGLAGTLGSLGRILLKRAAPLAAKLGGVAFLLLLVLLSGWLAVRVLEIDDRADSVLFWSLLALPIVIIVAAWLVGPELWSLNAFYRGKLRIAYAVRRLADGKTAVAYVNDADKTEVMSPPPPAGEPVPHGDVKAVSEPPLHDLKGHTPLTICAAAHVTTRGVAAHYGIPAMSFTFSPDRIRTFVPMDDEGHYQEISCNTEDLQASYPGAGRLTSNRVTTMSAVALAGAAVSPAMGRFRIGPTSALITFGNVRLGAWLPNPRYVRAGAGTDPSKHDRFPKVRLGYLVKEFLGIHDPSDPYVYVSDGGHWENTGLVELLRGRTPKDSIPREVIAVDADPGSPASVHQLSSAIDLARLECGVHVFIDLDPLRGYPEAPGGPVFAQRSVALGVMRRGTDWGLLWHCKPVLSKDSPTPLLAHREIDPEFPHTSTVDQFFDTSTYTAYRDLGRYNARELKLGRKRLGEELAKLNPNSPTLPPVPPPTEAGSWAVRDFVRIARDLPDELGDLIKGAQAALPTPP